jgi:hypothetical protein
MQEYAMAVHVQGYVKLYQTIVAGH